MGAHEALHDAILDLLEDPVLETQEKAAGLLSLLQTRAPARDERLPQAIDYQRALDVQSACNLSGVVLAFADVMPRINNEMYALDKGHDWRDRHPIVRLYAEQIAHLGRKADYTDAYKACEEKSKEKA